MQEPEILQVIQKQREYLDYIERHYRNVQRAWQIVQERCKDMPLIANDASFHALDDAIRRHDFSKLSPEEFEPYRRQFYPTPHEDGGLNRPFKAAWEHHQKHNAHHWQNWTRATYAPPRGWIDPCLHMIIDWIAMAYELGGTARTYFEENKEKIPIPWYAMDFMNEIFDRVYGKENPDD